MSAAPQAAQEPVIPLRLPLSTVNFILQTLDRNPLQASVAQVAGVIDDIQRQATTPPPAAPAAEQPAQPAAPANRGARRAKR